MENKAPAISRAAATLRLLGKSETPLGVQAIARQLDMVPSTCLHVLRALVAEELVSFDPITKHYALEAGVLTLARHWLARNPFSNLAQPTLDRLGKAFGVTMLAVQIVGLEHMIVVARDRANQSPLQISTQIGDRFPALISATGRCLAAFGGHSDAHLEARFKKLRWDQPPTLTEWRKQVKKTREQGFAVDAGHYIAGVTVVAAPVWETKTKLSVLVALGLGRALESELPALQDQLRDAARALTTQLCGT